MFSLINLFKKKPALNNAIHTILVYRHNGGWAFTDERVGLLHEPFVAGADDLIELLSKRRDMVSVTFSEYRFPNFDFELFYESGEVRSGTFYEAPAMAMRIWLCPALGKYFDKSPELLHIAYKAV